MQFAQYILGGIVVLVLGFAILRRVRQKQIHAAETPQRLFREIMHLLEGAKHRETDAVGSWKLDGYYQNHLFQFHAIADTLATRKLPSLWLMVTLPEPQPVVAKINLMMRPSGPTTFSNFDFLAHTLRTPDGYPEHAVIRSDSATTFFPSDLIRPHLDLFYGRYGKELMISPKGLRIVVQAAEAERSRYVVLREANFGDTTISASLAQECMDTLIGLQKDLIVDD